MSVIMSLPWTIAKSELFDDSLNRMSVTFGDLKEKLDKFIHLKLPDPVHIKYGKHDRRFRSDLAGLHHCHLRDDAVLIYELQNRVMKLVYIAPHAEIEGKRLKTTAKRLLAL